MSVDKSVSTLVSELELLVKKGADLPKGAVTLSSKQAKLDLQLETAAGDSSYYPGNDLIGDHFHSNVDDCDECPLNPVSSCCDCERLHNSVPAGLCKPGGLYQRLLWQDETRSEPPL